ncbi:MAG: hypothetical protein JRI44_13275 [Deltaproteobacteria bacterium]|nr:hypothetical protein [Deltaproteobacteria bacterium]
MKKYQSTGVVYGKLWGGGFGGYPARKLESKTKTGLIKKAEKMLDGSLDSGMGFEYLKGALLSIEEIETIRKNEKDYQRSEFESCFIGELDEEEQDFLIESEINFAI